MLFAAACGGPAGPMAPPPPPAPVAAPDIEVELSSVDRLLEAAELSPPRSDGVVDELLASPVLRQPDFQAEVEEWVEYWSDAAAAWVPDYLRRMGQFEEIIDSALAEREMPASLRYLPFIESGYNPAATSTAAAVGMWQFMPGTARGFGMEVTPLVDDRRDPFTSTDAAVDYLEALHDRFGSWFTALAAYNGGPTRTRRILNRYAPLAPPADSVFWALRAHFPRETRQFLPKLIGAIVVASSPGRYGYGDAPVDARFTFDEVSVPDATTLDVVAMAAEASEEEIKRLNPELVRGITPPGERFTLRVPPGHAETFAANYALIPEGDRVSFVEHTVVSGETLSHIAERYRIRVTDLEEANPGVRARYLRIGARLTVPIVTRGGE